MRDEEYMKVAVELAKKGCGRVSPNPMVGAVIVKDGKIIGEGYHARYGGRHAERAALDECRESPEGAVMYVTLEPCCHYGKQPPCTEAILKSGIGRVIVGAIDPNPKVAGKGIQYLRENGVEVTEGVLSEMCREIILEFSHFIKTGRPYVIMKYAMTMDGKIATYAGASRWITGEAARKRVHQDRNRYAAIMTGVGTVLADDPLLTCRQENGRNPIRIICDSRLRTPTDAQVVVTADQAPTIIATCCREMKRHQPYLDAGCGMLVIPELDGHVDLNALMETLGSRKIDSVLLEGGAGLNWSAMSQGIVNKVQAYIAPKVFGGAAAPGPVGGRGVPRPDGAFSLSQPVITMLGEDILVESEVQ